MWLRLTFYNEEPILMNMDLVEAIQEDGEYSVLSTNDGSYKVKESMEEIWMMLHSLTEHEISALIPEVPKEWK